LTHVSTQNRPHSAARFVEGRTFVYNKEKQMPPILNDRVGTNARQCLSDTP